MRIWVIEILLIIIMIHLLFINFTLVDIREIAGIKLCKDNPTLIIKKAGLSSCNCKELLEKYNIKANGGN